MRKENNREFLIPMITTTVALLCVINPGKKAIWRAHLTK